jgi:hypothetical protein
MPGANIKALRIEVLDVKPKSPKWVSSAWAAPRRLTDSELILTQLSAEGYQTSKTFEGADLVIVNTCGFIDDAVAKAWTRLARRWPPMAR